MSTPVERIFSLLKVKEIEQKEFAQLLGTTDKTVSAWKTGRSQSYTKYLPKISEVLGTTVEYLLTGKKEVPAAEDSSGPVVYEKLAKMLLEQGIDVGTLSDAQLQRLAKIIAAALEQ